MSLTFASTQYVDVGSAAVVDNLSAGTILVWINPTNVATGNKHIVYKNGTQRSALLVADTAAGDLTFRYGRSIANLVVRTATGFVTVNTWQMVGATWAASGVNGDQHLYRGTLSAIVAEAGSYVSQAVGSGTHDDAAANLQLGGNSTAGNSTVGQIAWLGIWSLPLTLGQIRAQQFRPRVTSGCVGFWHLGFNGTSTQPDWSGGANTGTVTGASQASHVPLGLTFGGSAA